MKDEYIIINKDKTIHKLDELIKEANSGKTISGVNSHMADSLIKFKQHLISESTTLIPEIEKAIDKGYDFAKQSLYRSDGSLQPKIKEYISNLKLDI